MRFTMHVLFTDYISNLAMARNGAPRMAIAACYGGPLLSIFSTLNCLLAVIIVLLLKRFLKEPVVIL